VNFRPIRTWLLYAAGAGWGAVLPPKNGWFNQRAWGRGTMR